MERNTRAVELNCDTRAFGQLCLVKLELAFWWILKIKQKITMAAEEFVLRWNNHQQNFATVVEDLWRHDTFTDVILCSEGRVFPAHRVILSACSPYFLEILSKVPEHQHPVVFLQGVPLKDLHSLLTFMYSGEVVVSNANGDMASFFRTAENLQIKGISDILCYVILNACMFSLVEMQF